MSQSDDVLKAVEQAFHAHFDDIEFDPNEEIDGRIYGVIVVKNNPAFSVMSRSERIRKLWEKIREIAGSNATNVGVLVLMDEKEREQAVV